MANVATQVVKRRQEMTKRRYGALPILPISGDRRESIIRGILFLAARSGN